MHFSKSAAAVAAVLYSSASAHLVMNTPAPYKGTPLVQVNPLDGGQYKFPCQYGANAAAYGGQPDGAPLNAGSSQKVAFTGSAVHGGGSCQFSVSYEFPPPADPKKWKVIHSIIGGCPADATGNLATTGTDADGRANGAQCNNADGKECMRSFEIPIPKDLKNGKASFAWTWFNKIGNREMYMNCAPVTISGGKEDDSFTNSLPELFLANIPGQCQTASGSHNIGFPNPGQSVVKNYEPDAAGQGTCPAAGAGGQGGNQSPPASSPASYPTPSPPSYNTPVAPPSRTPGAVFAPNAGNNSQQQQQQQQPQTTLVVTPAQPTSPASGNQPPAASPQAPGAQAVPCQTDGAIVCLPNNQFGVCDHQFAVPRLLAAGTRCTEGKIEAIPLVKRHVHLHKRHAHVRRFS